MAAVRKRKRVPIRARVLADLATRRNWRRGAELGVLDGRTLLHLLGQCPKLTMIGVDLWRPQPEKGLRSPDGGRSYERHGLEAMYASLVPKVEQCGPRGRLLRMTTTEASLRFPDGFFDFVFIDADHTYEGVSGDIAAWRPKVREGGWLMGHDWAHRDFPGVTKAVREMLGEPRAYPDRIWAVAV